MMCTEDTTRQGASHLGDRGHVTSASWDPATGRATGSAPSCDQSKMQVHGLSGELQFARESLGWTVL